MIHDIKITAEQVNAESGNPVHGYRAECSCGQFVGIAPIYPIVVEFAEEHMAETLLDTA